MKKNTIVTIVVAAMVAASLSACGAKNEAPAETPAVVEEVAEEVTSEVVEVDEEVTPEVEKVAEEVTPEVEEVAEEVTPEVEEEGLMLPDSNLKFKSIDGIQPEIDPRDDTQIMYSKDDFFRAYCMSPVLVGDTVSVEKFYEELNKAFVELDSSFVVDKPCTPTDVTGTTSYIQIGHIDVDGKTWGYYHLLQDAGQGNYLWSEICDYAYTDDVDAAIAYCEEILLTAPFELVEGAE